MVVLTDCSHGDLRLVDGDTLSEGHVEICFNGSYKLICGHQWDILDARVACRQLGFSDESETTRPWNCTSHLCHLYFHI